MPEPVGVRAAAATLPKAFAKTRPAFCNPQKSSRSRSFIFEQFYPQHFAAWRKECACRGITAPMKKEISFKKAGIQHMLAQQWLQLEPPAGTGISQRTKNNLRGYINRRHREACGGGK